MSADPDPHWDIKLATFGVAFLGCFLVSLLTRLASDAAGVDVPLHIRGLAVSGLHAIVVVSTATLTFLRGDGDIGVGGEEPLLGSLGLCVSVAYFVWDVRNMLRTGYQPLVPLLMHHVISGASMSWIGASMSWIACCVPRAVWHTSLLQMYTCILQMSEATVPVNNLVTLWEWRGAHDRPSYTLLRWLLPASKAANSPDPMVREGTLVSQAAARRVAADAAPPHRILPRAGLPRVERHEPAHAHTRPQRPALAHLQLSGTR